MITLPLLVHIATPFPMHPHLWGPGPRDSWEVPPHRTEAIGRVARQSQSMISPHLTSHTGGLIGGMLGVWTESARDRCLICSVADQKVSVHSCCGVDGETGQGLLYPQDMNCPSPQPSSQTNASQAACGQAPQARTQPDTQHTPVTPDQPIMSHTEETS